MPTSAPRPILIIKTGDTLDTLRPNIGDFEHWIETGLTAGAGTGSGDKADPANAHQPPPIQVLDARHARLASDALREVYYSPDTEPPSASIAPAPTATPP